MVADHQGGKHQGGVIRSGNRDMRRREFIAGLGGAAAWSAMARAQAIPIIGFVNDRSEDGGADFAAAFRKGLVESGYFAGENVAVEYHWLDGRFDQLPAVMADLVRRRVALIVSAGPALSATAAKAATYTIPIVFSVGDDPVRHGLVASLARPGGNATGINYFNQEVDGKRLGLFHELVPSARRIAVLINPSNGPAAETTLQGAQNAARGIGLQVQVLNATTSHEIEGAFTTLARERIDALFVAGDGFFASRRVQFAILAARDRIPAAYVNRDHATAGGLMSYGADFTDSFRQVGVYAGKILKGMKPADLPVVQSTKFQFVINNVTARALGIDVPPTLLAIADEVIE
jgi:putative tryptophan/tyrosine transport system substrate-binding protein